MSATDPYTRRIVLMRHGEAENDATDFERRLTAGGETVVKNTAREMANYAPPIDIIVCSSAVRAAGTAQILASMLDPAPAIQQRRDLYLATPSVIATVLRELPDERRCALLVGHNPGLSELASAMLGRRHGLSPAAYVSRAFDLPRWSELTFN